MLLMQVFLFSPPSSVPTATRYFELDDDCLTELPDCPGGGLPGTYEMAMKAVAAGTSSGTVRVDARYRNGQWFQQYNGGVVEELDSVVPMLASEITIVVDLATGDFQTVLPSVDFMALCYCSVDPTPPPGPTVSPPPASPTCASGGYAESPSGETAACLE